MTVQPAAEILAFRIGELRGISRWRSRLESIGLDEKLVDQTMEDAGMVLLQVERVLRIVSDTAAQVSRTLLHCGFLFFPKLTSIYAFVECLICFSSL